MEILKLEDQIIQNFNEYSQYVNEERAIPYFYDGLKPVARRILYAMYQMKLTPDKQTRKCATIIGRTMPLHPHGDASIYGALVRLAQDFSVKIPLIIGQGNFGSLELPPAAMRYCVTGDTLINTNRGSIPISTLIDNSLNNSEYDINLVINSINNVENSVNKFFNSGKHNIYYIKAKNGLILKGSFNHPVMILTPKMEMKWKILKDINIGDKVLISKTGTNLFGLNEDLIEAKMLGCMISEGYITTQNRMGINNTDLEMIYPVKDFCEREFNTSTKICQNIKGYYDYTISNINLIEKFIQKYKYDFKAKNKTIPLQVMKGTKQYQKEFFKYLFEGDGSISTSGIQYSTYSYILAQQIQILLLQNFGIFSYISTSMKEYKCVITGESLEKFFTEIGFVSERKQKRLLEEFQLYNSKEKIAHNSYYTISEINKYIRNKYKKEFFIKNTFANKKAIKKLKNKISIKDYRKIEYLLDNFLAVPIIEIGQLPAENVYSVKVNSECNSFIANGFINHNTEAKLSPLGYSMVEKLNKKIVPMVLNYDGTEEEPVFLPTPVPILLNTGTMGIGVGMATSIPSHNLNEVIDATIYLIQNSNATTDDLLEYIKGPDFPSGCSIVNQKDFLGIYKTGKGSFLTRAEFNFSGNTLRIQKLPFHSIAAKIEEQIYEAKEKGMFKEFSSIVNTTSNNQELEITLRGNFNPEEISKNLCQVTDCERRTHLDFHAIDDNPKIYNLLSFLTRWLEMHFELVKKELTQDKEQLERKLEIALGILKALKMIDEVIAIIKESNDKAAAKINLIAEGFTSIQAEAILEIKLSRLTHLESLEIEKQIKDYDIKISNLNTLLTNEDCFKEYIISNMKKYKLDSSRKSKIEQSEFPKTNKQKDNKFYLTIFPNYVKISEIPSKGKYLIGDMEHPIYILSENNVVPIKNAKESIITNVFGILNDNDVLHFSKDGYVKRTKASSLKVARKAIATKQENIISVIQANQGIILITSKTGKQVQFDLEDVPITGRIAKGVCAVKIGDEEISKIELISSYQKGIKKGRNKLF